MFVFVPLVGAAVISLQRTDGFGSGTFAGLANYTRLASDGLFWRSLVNTTAFTVLVTPLSMALGLGAAVLLNSVLPARGVFRSVLVLPMAISGRRDGAARGAGLRREQRRAGQAALHRRAARGLLAVGERGGLLLGGARDAVVAGRVQHADLPRRPAGHRPELYEAAVLDGAGRWQQFRHLTVPLLGASTFFLLILNVIYSFQVFDLVFVMTGGGPRNATSVLVTYAYDTGFDVRDQGYAAAIGMVLLVLTMAFTLVQWRTSRGRDEVG